MEELQAFMEVSMRLRHLIQSQSKELKFLRIRVEELDLNATTTSSGAFDSEPFS